MIVRSYVTRLLFATPLNRLVNMSTTESIKRFEAILFQHCILPVFVSIFLSLLCVVSLCASVYFTRKNALRLERNTFKRNKADDIFISLAFDQGSLIWMNQRTNRWYFTKYETIKTEKTSFSLASHWSS